MSTKAPVNFDVNYLRSQVIATYDRVAREPTAHYHFHRGSDYAHDFLGYDRDEIDALPAIATERFAGVGNPLAVGPVAPGSTVLDHACGGGMDLLLAARQVGPTGRAIGVDMTPAMVDAATGAAKQAGARWCRRGPPGLLRGPARARRERGPCNLQRRAQPGPGQARRAQGDSPRAQARR
ncbi:MAG: methyltransferase domain-containing protein [Pseudomonadota bacterium]|nr:methyltransferase domain-containing protein [Pseudomonadota bacterium]